jgi:hypothetical protein
MIVFNSIVPTTGLASPIKTCGLTQSLTTPAALPSFSFLRLVKQACMLRNKNASPASLERRLCPGLDSISL